MVDPTSQAFCKTVSMGYYVTHNLDVICLSIDKTESSDLWGQVIAKIHILLKSAYVYLIATKAFLF